MVKKSIHHSSRRRSSLASPADLFSAQTLQHVVLPKREKQKQQVEQPQDPVGDHMTMILNSHPGFRYKPRYPSLGDHQDDQVGGMTLSPLLSRRNFKFLLRQLQRVKTLQLHSLYDSAVSLLQVKSRSRRETLAAFGSLIVVYFGIMSLMVLALVTTSHAIISWSVQSAYLVLLQIMVLLVDWNELRQQCNHHPWLGTVWNMVAKIGHWMDSVLFLGRRYVGREWNKEDFVWTSDPMKAQSRHKDLLSFPPPEYQHRPDTSRRDPNLLDNNEKWSQQTLQHMQAINYCFSRVRDSQIRRQQNRRQRRLHERTSSMAAVAEGDSCEVMPSSSPFGGEVDQDKSRNRVMSMSTKLGEHTEHVVGLTSTVPAEGIELVRDDFDHDEHSADPSTPHSDLAGDRMRIPSDDCFASSSPFRNRPGDGSVCGSVNSCSSDVAADMSWMDLGSRIGIRLLNSSHLQHAVASQETAERLKNITQQFVVRPKDMATPYGFHRISDVQSPAGDGSIVANALSNSCATLSKSPCRPVHSMWTSAAAAAASVSNDDQSVVSEQSDRSDFQTNRSTKVTDVAAPPPIIRTSHLPEGKENTCERLMAESPFQEVEVLAQAPGSVCAFTLAAETAIDEEYFSIPKTKYEVGASNQDSLQLQLEHIANIPTWRPRQWDGDAQLRYLHPVTEKRIYRREPLKPGTKVAAPVTPIQPGRRKLKSSTYQMATVVSSERIWVASTSPPVRGATNAVSVTCTLDKAYLRDGEFSELSFRVLDEWSPRYMPKHSKVPVGACVATSFGIGVLVGWRVEDDCHVIRSLWQRRGKGTGHAYINRAAIHCIVEAAVGFEVCTKRGEGKVMAYVDGGKDFQRGRYVVAIHDEGLHKNCVVGLRRDDILSCHGAQFIPVIEHIREAANYQTQLDNYKAALRQQKFTDEDNSIADDQLWKFWSNNWDILWNSFLRAVEEDSESVENVMSSLIDFLERIDRPPDANYSNATGGAGDCSTSLSVPIGQNKIEETDAHHEEGKANEDGLWILDDIFGGIFGKTQQDTNDAVDSKKIPTDSSSVCRQQHPDSYKQAFAVVRTLMKTVSLARAASAGEPRFKLAMTICREFLMFVRTLLKVQQKNISPNSLLIWRRAIAEIVSTFGPIKERLAKIGRGIAQRMEQQGRKAKIKCLRFIDLILLDEVFLSNMSLGEWNQCLSRIEIAMVKAKIVEKDSCEHYRKTMLFVYEHLVLLSSKESGAGERSAANLARFSKLVQWFAAPKRSLLKIFCRDDVLELLERILVRVLYREKLASRMLTIHASNFHSLRHLRILKNLSVAGRLWIPLLDAADEEFSWIVSKMPEKTKDFMCPLSSLFSLCVAQFHKIIGGNLSKDWLDFLMEDDATRIIHDLDMKLILSLESIAKDVKEIASILPYYPSIDDDILKLMDEVEIDKFLKEASDAIDDADKLANFIREKATIAVERFLAYLPKMSIPVERRDLADGWVLTCHSASGGDLTLSDLTLSRDDLICQVLGCEVMGEDALFNVIGDDDLDSSSGPAISDFTESDSNRHVESSILDHIRDMILQARRHGNWTVGTGGVGEHPPTDNYVASVMHGLPITQVLDCGIELWRNLEIDDDELLEVAIRDVSYQIQLHKEIEERSAELGAGQPSELETKTSTMSAKASLASRSSSFENARSRFNPRVDPTVLFLEIKNLTLHLEEFRFRIEKGEKRTIFDPVFEGCGTVTMEKITISLRVECARESTSKKRSDLVAPVLLLQELDVRLENVRLKVADTGADWLLNKAVEGFGENITHVVAANLKEQIQEQAQAVLEQLNSYFLVNPEVLLKTLGITMDDLDETIVFV